MGFFKSLMSVISTDGKTGTPFKLDKNHTVYYKGNGVTVVDAAHVAGFLKGYGYFTETSQNDVQIFSEKAGAPVALGFIIGGKDVSAETAEYFKGAGNGLQEYFTGRTVTSSVLDTKLTNIRTL